MSVEGMVFALITPTILLAFREGTCIVALVVQPWVKQPTHAALQGAQMFTTRGQIGMQHWHWPREPMLVVSIKAVVHRALTI